MRIAVFPGTFDPLTIGHVNIINRGIRLFDEIHIAIGINDKKTTFFTLEERINWLSILYGANPSIKIGHYEGLTVDYCKKVNAKFILRGLRGFEDFEYEKQIALVNRELSEDIESIFLYSNAEFGAISSSFVREILTYKGKIDSFVPKEILTSVLRANPS